MLQETKQEWCEVTSGCRLKGVACWRQWACWHGVWSKVAHPIGWITLISADSLRNNRRGGDMIISPPISPRDTTSRLRVYIRLSRGKIRRTYHTNACSHRTHTPTPIPVEHSSILVSIVGHAPLCEASSAERSGGSGLKSSAGRSGGSGGVCFGVF